MIKYAYQLIIPCYITFKQMNTLLNYAKQYANKCTLHKTEKEK